MRAKPGYLSRAGSTEETEEDHLTGLELGLEQFLEVFNLPPLGDPLEKQRRAEILKENQQKVLEANQAFLVGNQSWRVEIPSRALSGYRDVGPAGSWQFRGHRLKLTFTDNYNIYSQYSQNL